MSVSLFECTCLYIALPVPYISESCIEIKIKFVFSFTLLCGASKGLGWEGLDCLRVVFTKNIYFFDLGLLSRTFTIQKAAREGEGYLFNSFLPLYPLSKHKLLTTKLRALNKKYLSSI